MWILIRSVNGFELKTFWRSVNAMTVIAVIISESRNPPALSDKTVNHSVIGSINEATSTANWTLQKHSSISRQRIQYKQAVTEAVTQWWPCICDSSLVTDIWHAKLRVVVVVVNTVHQSYCYKARNERLMNGHMQYSSAEPQLQKQQWWQTTAKTPKNLGFCWNHQKPKTATFRATNFYHAIICEGGLRSRNTVCPSVSQFQAAD